MDIEKLFTQISELALKYGSDILIALVVLFIGFKLVNLFTHALHSYFQKADYDEALETFLVSLSNIGLKAVVAVAALGTAGVESTSFAAVLAAGGLAIGMALSGTLQNFAGGTLILMLRPFKVGDVIESQGYTGKVAEIQIFNTILNTPDNKRIILPNGPVANGSLVNYSAEETRRVDFVFGIGYDDDIDKARSIIEEILKSDERVLKDEDLTIVIGELADSSVNFTVRAWAKSADYWGVFFDTQEKVKKAFDAQGVSIPFPQTDVHLHKTA
ncbi:mechanosensitive ion channel family protein [Persicirhabdus sediminis]|uniref:Mechanosensitive ion channel n=1 Tax=Persicirhabdus sediminis TaxID=454144 RepID=A0A8J7MAR8_9BACT|nr:mechanosensitive ion channel domain-containing protein [Persicirhabdus sediminis]MBK1789546.1 mechanosensitive ion channel [Persicirhabdus sediminis]